MSGLVTVAMETDARRRLPQNLPSRVLMTVDAVGGVWRYAMDLASAAQSMGIEVIFAGFGPPPSVEQADEARRIGTLEWVPAPSTGLRPPSRSLLSYHGFLKSW